MQQHIVFSISSNKKFAQWPHSHIPRGLNPRSRGENTRHGYYESLRLGSSPLTRGKHSRIGTCTPATRFIPAHAGKTTPTRRPWCGSSAHPRSRGENGARRGRRRWCGGSSPLTRGKLPALWAFWADVGLIPAHAGKTRGRSKTPCAKPAHPRSRGENAAPREERDALAGLIPAHAGKTQRLEKNEMLWPGSSPLTRGKRFLCQERDAAAGLIPAHAGKTAHAPTQRQPSPAHPRSRGENQGENIVNLSKQGSSPLTRGKPHGLGQVLPDRGLIPAHAGKTSACRGFRGAAAAHPRSRGENVTTVTKARAVEGSSPLTRGKLLLECCGRSRTRLIPAHAGKTNFPDPDSRQARAHPRSRGENRLGEDNDVAVSGSSPLTRGKPHKAWTKALQARLIPAHAGKTVAAACQSSCRTAHPRSRGENSEKTAGGAGNRGSSPLTRGKQRPQLRRRLRQRLIPAHAGKTSAPPGLTSSRPAHPRSRGENRSRHSREQ